MSTVVTPETRGDFSLSTGSDSYPSVVLYLQCPMYGSCCDLYMATLGLAHALARL